jgi:hypothetical protein
MMRRGYFTAMPKARHRHRTRASVRITLAVFACSLLLLALPRVLYAARAAETDIGYIESVQEGTIYIQGTKGLHILEALRVCLWCEPGLEVTVTFSGYARATLRPASRSHHGKPLQALLLKDGRWQD